MSAPASSSATLRCEIDGRGIATLLLDRPEKGNCYNQAMLDALVTELARLAADAAVRAVVLRGAGKHFCVGAEIGAPAPVSSEPRKPRATLPGVCDALDRLAKPTVALVHGACIGGGVALVCCCDVVIAEDDAFFSMPEVRLGFAPGPLIPIFLRAIDARQLRRYLLSGERFKADEAMRIGLVHALCPAEAKEQGLARLIDELLMAGPNAAAHAKALLRRLGGTPISQELLAELQADFDQRFHSDEANEGRASFREKRKPAWYGEPP
jgi:methylglutaconyl-CoA hydratase